MGTKSLTFVVDKTTTVLNMYRHFDGHPHRHGAQLYEFLRGLVVVNGLPVGDKRRLANGMGCLAAQMVAHFKDGPGNIHLQHPDARNCGQEYEYIVRVADNTDTSELTSFLNSSRDIEIEVLGHGESLFRGTVDEFGRFCETYCED